MTIIKRYIVVIEFLLILPGALFMAALFARDIQPAPYEPAQTARRLVDWYSARPILCLDIFLIALPFVAFVIGCATVIRNWRTDAVLRRAATETFGAVRANLAAVLIAAVTLVAGIILAIVALHVITD